MSILRKYGVAAKVRIPIPKLDDTDFAATGDWTPAAGDVKVSKDGGDVANITTLPTAVTGVGSVLWEFSLSATEMQAAEVTVQVVDAVTGRAVEDQALLIETYGNAAAEHAFDLDAATPVVDLSTTAKADVNTEVDNALNTAVPASPIANSINERVKILDDNYTLARASKLDNLDATLSSRGTSANQTTILNRLGDFGGTGLNTIKGFFQALLRSDGGVTGANVPNEINEVENTIAGDYDGANESVEALRDRGDAAWTTATGFSTHSAADVWNATTRELTAATNLTSDGAEINATAGVIDSVTTVTTNTDMVAEPTTLLTTQMTESYAVDGVAPTLAQSLFMVWSALSEFAIVSTTITAKKLDGSTTAMTFTLDDAVSPTSRTRAT